VVQWAERARGRGEGAKGVAMGAKGVAKGAKEVAVEPKVAVGAKVAERRPRRR
jgi:hypothetical protein